MDKGVTALGAPAERGAVRLRVVRAATGARANVVGLEVLVGEGAPAAFAAAPSSSERLSAELLGLG